MRTPARLSLAALAAVALALPLAPARAEVPLPPPPPGTVLRHVEEPPSGWRASTAIGTAIPAGGDGQLLLLGEAARPVAVTPGGLPVDLVLPLRFVYGLPSTVAGVKTVAWSFELAPAARLSFRLAPAFTLRTDLGAGVALGWTRVTMDAPFVGKQSTTKQATTGVVRVRAAVEWAFSPRTTFFVEPLDLGYDLEGGSDWSLLFGATFRL
jgi:hypothetical protein